MLQLNKNLGFVPLLSQMQPNLCFILWLIRYICLWQSHLILVKDNAFSPHEPLYCCLIMLIVWNWAQHLLLLWEQSSFFCVIWKHFNSVVLSFQIQLYGSQYIFFLWFCNNSVPADLCPVCVLSPSSEHLTSESQRPVMLILGRNVQYQNLSPGLWPRSLENHWSHDHDWVKAGVWLQSDIEPKCKMRQIWARLGMCVIVLGQK